MTPLQEVALLIGALATLIGATGTCVRAIVALLDRRDARRRDARRLL